jgi:hypothetical protein
MFRDQICMYRDQTVWSLMLSTVLVNAGHYYLPVPIDGGDIATLAKALVQRI